MWEETIILLPDNVHYVFLSATIPNARQFAEWICHLHKQVGCLLAHLPTIPPHVFSDLDFFVCVFPWFITSKTCFLSSIAMPCSLHRLPSNTAAALHLSSRGRWTPPCCWWKCEVKHNLHSLGSFMMSGLVFCGYILSRILSLNHKHGNKLLNKYCFSPGRLQRGQFQHSYASTERCGGFWEQRRRQVGPKRT